MQANGDLLPAEETLNQLPARYNEGRGNGEKAKPTDRVRLTGNIVRRNS